MDQDAFAASIRAGISGIPARGVFRITPEALKSWNNAPKSQNQEMSWYGLKNLHLLPAGEYTPSPNQNVINCIRGLFENTHGWNLQLPVAVVFFHTQITILNDWFS